MEFAHGGGNNSNEGATPMHSAPKALRPPREVGISKNRQYTFKDILV